MAFVLRRCRELYNAALQERSEAWQKCGVNITEASQSAQLPAIKEVRPEYRDIHSQVLQDVLTRLDRAFQRFFARVKTWRDTRLSAFQGANRYNSFTYKQFGNGATLDNGFLVLSKIGRMAVRWSRPLEGTPKTVTISREADGWYVCFSCADVPVQPLPATGQETGIDLGIEAFATLSDGTRIFSPGWYRKAERALKTAQRRVIAPQEGEQPQAQGGHAAGQGASDRCDASGGTFTTRRRSPSCERTTRSITRTCRRPTWSRITISPRASRCGVERVLEHPELQGSMRRSEQSLRSILPTPARHVRAVAYWSRKAYPSAGTPARTVERACIGTTTRPRT